LVTVLVPLTGISSSEKTSIFKSLNLLYISSGWIKDNIFIDHFHEDVPFLSARADCRFS
ncbi:hypothetical protein Golob_027462, partial [Gossypium lobatum]|nr:hypothetical protein [Gossypium lobatum]